MTSRLLINVSTGRAAECRLRGAIYRRPFRDNARGFSSENRAPRIAFRKSTRSAPRDVTAPLPVVLFSVNRSVSRPGIKEPFIARRSPPRRRALVIANAFAPGTPRETGGRISTRRVNAESRVACTRGGRWFFPLSAGLPRLDKVTGIYQRKASRGLDEACRPYFADSRGTGGSQRFSRRLGFFQLLPENDQQLLLPAAINYDSFEITGAARIRLIFSAARRHSHFKLHFVRSLHFISYFLISQYSFASRCRPETRRYRVADIYVSSFATCAERQLKDISRSAVFPFYFRSVALFTVSPRRAGNCAVTRRDHER